MRSLMCSSECYSMVRNFEQFPTADEGTVVRYCVPSVIVVKRRVQKYVRPHLSTCIKIGSLMVVQYYLL